MPSCVRGHYLVPVSDGIEGWIEIVYHDGKQRWTSKEPMRVKIEA